METLVYQTSPTVTLATNQFVNVPIVLQYESTPLIEVIQEQSLGYTSSIPIFHKDGTYLAKVNGTRVFPTEKGKLAGIQMDKYADRTVCKMGSTVLFEVHHQPGDAFKIVAELFAPDGYFVRFQDSPQPGLIDVTGNAIKVGGVIMSNNVIRGFRIGIWLKSNGSCAIGCR